jgi:hypothetical protein
LVVESCMDIEFAGIFENQISEIVWKFFRVSIRVLHTISEICQPALITIKYIKIEQIYLCILQRIL